MDGLIQRQSRSATATVVKTDEKTQKPNPELETAQMTEVQSKNFSALLD